MTYAFYYDAPGNERIYAQIKERIGPEQPRGLVLHLVTTTDGGLRHLNVWKSRQDWERFRDEHIEPAVGATLEAMGIPAPATGPAEHELGLVDIQTG